MRLAKFNRLGSVAVTSAVLTTLVGFNGCKAPVKPQPSHQTVQPVDVPNQMHPATDQTTQPATLPTGLQANQPIALPATGPATQPTSGPVVPPVVNVPPIVPVPPVLPMPPVTQPTTVPAGVPATVPTAMPSTLPASMPTSQPVEPPINNAVRPVALANVESDRTLAEQLAGVAELEFDNPVKNTNQWPWIWQHQAAVISAAAELDPSEGRFPRLIADAMERAHDIKGEKAALTLTINTDPSDEFSFIRLVDLYTQEIIDLPKRIEYLRAVVSQAYGKVPVNVQAHAGYRLAQSLLEHGEDNAADQALTSALQLCPSSLECLKLQYNLFLQRGNFKTYDQAAHLVELLKANPLQTAYCSQLADLIADAGLAQDSLPFYRLAVDSGHSQGDPARHEMLGWAAAMFIYDTKGGALGLNTTLLKIDPNYTPAYFLQLVITQHVGDTDAFKKALSEANIALGNRVVYAINKIAPNAADKPTTRPINSAEPVVIPDLAPIVAQLNQNGTRDQKEEFAEAVADLAFLDGYFGKQPEVSGRYVDALKAILPESSPELVRLQGWNDLLSGKPDDARNKFLRVSEKDPLAALGLVKILNGIPAEQPRAIAEAKKLLTDYPSGLIGAILFDQLSDGKRRIPTTQAMDLQTLVNNFPPSLFLSAERPGSLYTIHLTARTVGTHVGDPMLAEVKIDNLSSYDLTIGHDGYIKPELIFSLTDTILPKAAFQAFDNISGPPVLAPKTGTFQIVRLDQTQLLSFLDKGEQTDKLFSIASVVNTNRTVGGAGGVSASLDNNFLRFASTLTNQNVNSAMNDLANGRADQKISALNQLAEFVRKMRAFKPKAGQVAPDIKPLVQSIHRARGDTLEAVSAWAAKCEFDLTDPADQIRIFNELADSADWRHRQVALTLVDSVPTAVRDTVLTALMNDPQSSVRADVRALQGKISAPPPPAAPTTAPTGPRPTPTTVPTTAPTGVPPAP